MPTPLLTAARSAVWEAITTWPALENTFRRRYLFDDRPGRLPQRPSPTMGDLPAIAIYPDSASTVWTLNQAQEVRYPLRIDLWTREWNLGEGEALWEEIVRALVQNMPTTSDIRPRVVKFTPASAKVIELGDDAGGPTATRWTFQVDLLAGLWNPKASV
jgi:hypothetical protein